MSYTKYRQEREALENAYARRLLIEYGIREVTTQRQAKNGTREFEFPVSTYANTNEYYKKWLKSQGRSLKDTPRLRIACFKSGYVRNQNSRQMFLIDGKLEIRKYIGKARTLIWSQLARMNYMLEYYLKNYK
jgi:hypothetical protein